MAKNKIELHGMIPSHLSTRRLDQALAKLFPSYSRSQLQAWIKAGFVRVNGQIQNKVRQVVLENQTIDIVAPLTPDERWTAQAIPLDILYEDDAILVINKPAGLVVHPGAGKPDNTLLNALLHHAPDLDTVPRAGIVHRLDKNTTGLLVIARTLESHHYLIQQMKQRKIVREYEAIVSGTLVAGSKIDAKIGRHPIHRTHMAVVDSGKPAITHYRVIERFPVHTHIQVRLETGRTHQIRVHLAHAHHPIVGDPVYGGRLQFPPQCSELLKNALTHFRRQALHASTLRLQHPIDHRVLEWKAPLPEDMANLLKLLREHP